MGFIFCVEKYNTSLVQLILIVSRHYLIIPELSTVKQSLVHSSARMNLKIGHQTVLQVPGIENVDAAMLLGKNIICSVIINLKYIVNYGNMPELEIYVRSCIVVDVMPKIEKEHILDDDVQQYHRENPNSVRNLRLLTNEKDDISMFDSPIQKHTIDE